jgi:hypothetical protein
MATKGKENLLANLLPSSPYTPVQKFEQTNVLRLKCIHPH